MQKMRFQVKISASRDRVWKTMWCDDTFRQWAGIIDPGTHMVGELVEGDQVQFISGNGYGVTSLVEKLVPEEFLLLRHSVDTADNGLRVRGNEWSGGEESYRLTQTDGSTTLAAVFDVPLQQQEYFAVNYPKAFDRIKYLAESDSV